MGFVRDYLLYIQSLYKVRKEILVRINLIHIHKHVISWLRIDLDYLLVQPVNEIRVEF